MRYLVLPLSAMLLAGSSSCSTGTSSSNGGTDAGGAGSATHDHGGVATSDAGATASDGAASGPYLPAGYTLTPEITQVPVRHFSAATQVIDASKKYVAVIETDVGRIVLQLLSAETPISCNSFVFLAGNHFYDGIAFHRVIDGFMAQTGDPNTIAGAPGTWGTGGAGYMFGLEVTPSLSFATAGVVGMARSSSPDSNGSQFFITLAAASHLNQEYTVFADVTEGFDVLPKIVRGEPPAVPTRITSLYIGEKAR